METLLNVQDKLFINNKFVDAKDGKVFSVVNPSTEEVIAYVAEASSVDVNEAVKAARYAFDQGPWKRKSAKERGEYLYKIAQLLKRDAEDFAQLESTNNGKPIMESRNVDLPLTIQCFEYFAGLADKIEGSVIPVDPSYFNYTVKEPVGVVAQILPFNFPLLMLAWKLGPSLAAGCTSIVKPAEQTPLTALRFAKLLLEVGLPPGVVNIVTGDGKAGEALSKHMDIDKIAFTGSTAVGRLIAEAAAKSNLKKVSLELGGKAPNIVFKDADIDDAVKGVVTSIWFNSGQVCCAGSRLYMEESIKEEFVKKLKVAAEKIVVGDPLDPGTQMGPLVSKEQFEKVHLYLNKGFKEGAEILTGGYTSSEEKGYFVRPTIFDNVKDNCTIAREEIFGPVVSIFTFKDEEDLIRRANETLYGLSAGVWTKDVNRLHRLAKELKAGTIWANCFNVFDAASPFGGMKQSGWGRELGQKAVELYTEIKSVWIKIK